MTCDRMQRLISDGYERRLTPDERLAIREHIQTCATCAIFERNLRSGLDAIHRMPDITPSRKLWESVHTLAAVQPRTSPRRIAHQALGIAGAGLTVALVAVVTILLINSHGGSLPPDATKTARQGFAPAASQVVVAPSPSPATVNSALVAGIGTPDATPATTATPDSGATPEPTATPLGTAPSIIYVSPTPVTLDKQMAEDTVVGYFHAINLLDYAQAYAYLGDAMQQTQTYESFASGFSDTARDTVTITTITASGPNAFAVTLHLDAEQINQTVFKYDGTWVVGIEGNVPKIVSADVTEEQNDAITPTAVPNNLCRSNEITATASYKATDDAITGSIIVTYGGKGTCVLASVPQIEIVDANGTVLKTAQIALNPGIVPKPLVLENSQRAQLLFIWNNWCAAATSPASPASTDGVLSFRITLVPNDKPITIAAVRPNGEPLTATPRCTAVQQDSTITVQGFARDTDS